MTSAPQYVTLVARGGTPVRLGDQMGAPYPTTGQGSLVFSDAPKIENAVFPNAQFPSVNLVGNPTADTPAQGDNDRSIATTEWVQTELESRMPPIQSITGALTLVADANAKAVLTSIITALGNLGFVTDETT